jgi:hypothetical protein
MITSPLSRALCPIFSSNSAFSALSRQVQKLRLQNPLQRPYRAAATRKTELASRVLKQTRLSPAPLSSFRSTRLFATTTSSASAKTVDQIATNTVKIESLKKEKTPLQKDLGHAIAWLEKGVKEDAPSAQFNLGVCYYLGVGVEKNPKKAFECFEQALSTWYWGPKYGSIQYAHALCYEAGIGVAKDLERALIEYDPASWNRCSLATFKIASSFEKGEGVTQDFDEAADLYEKTIKQAKEVAQEKYKACALAEYNISMCYLKGEGTPQDFGRAVDWLLKAANHGNISARGAFGVLLNKGQALGKDPERAIAFFWMAALDGDETAQYNLALCYYSGLGVKQDFKEAVRRFSDLVKCGRGPLVAQSKYILGTCYRDGKGVPKDPKQAAAWFDKIAAYGFPNDAHIFSIHDEDEPVVSKSLYGEENEYRLADQKEAFEQSVRSIWYRQQGMSDALVGWEYAAEEALADAQYALRICADAQYALALMYEQGKGVRQNPTKAAKLFQAAAEQGHTLATYKLGECYRDGKGIPPDRLEAEKCFERARANEYMRLLIKKSLVT